LAEAQSLQSRGEEYRRYQQSTSMFIPWPKINMKKSCLLVFLGLAIVGSSPSFAQSVITFGPKETRINGSIPYTVIGNYKAHFRSFKGQITLTNKSIESVYLEIEARSIASNCPWCDRLARSHRLLYTAKYPKIIFKSWEIFQDQGQWMVKGELMMHGITRPMTFPFDVNIIKDPISLREILEIKGTWVFNRKAFNIIWNKVLDRGGIIVGDNITVQWGIKARI
jgi:polyisoprenoid-binding protein YceI